jgi:transcriptional regulator with XRE-family HTH domain
MIYMAVPKLYRKQKPITKLIDPNKTIDKLYNLFSIYNSIPPERLKKNFANTLCDNNIELLDVVKALRLSRNTIYAYVNSSHIAKPTLELLVRICVEFKIDIEDFLENEE